MLVDANLLLLAEFERNPFFERAGSWLDAALNGTGRVGLPWLSIGAFVRIATNPRATDPPLSVNDAWSTVEMWLGLPNVWIPGPTPRHADVLGGLIRRYQLTGNLVTDGRLAALAIKHGLVLYSADTDFARFEELRWVNPLRAGAG
jgi:toxin-antitoxin system PIN domain toxin